MPGLDEVVSALFLGEFFDSEFRGHSPFGTMAAVHSDAGCAECPRAIPPR